MSLKVCLLAAEPLYTILSDKIKISSSYAVFVHIEDSPDLVLCFNKEKFTAGIEDFCRQNNIKFIGVNKAFLRLETSKFFAKMFSANHGLLCPRLLPIEHPDYPQVVRLDRCIDGKDVRIVHSDMEKKSYTTEFAGEKYFVEEYMDGEPYSAAFYYTPDKFINFANIMFSDLQKEKFNILQNRLEQAFRQEQAMFSSFIFVDLIWNRKDWYILGYRFIPYEKDIENILSVNQDDLISTLISR